MFAKVLVDVAHSNVDRLFTYQLQEDSDIALGQRVLVPFGAGNRAIEGFVLELCNEAPDEVLNIKRIIKAMEPYPALTGEQITLAKWISKSYHCLLVEALRLMIPAQLRGGRVKEKTERIVRINADIDPHQALDSLKNSSGVSRAPKQSEVLELLCRMNTAVSVADINAFIPNATAAVNALIKKGILTDDDYVVYRDPFASVNIAPSKPLELTADQRSALEAINKSIDGRAGTSLLFGVTGSGKTEVYMQAISHALSLGGQAIVLVPEISLTPQAMQRSRWKVCAPSAKLCAPCGQTTHAPQAVHFSARNSSSGAAEKLSGLWHQAQRMLQPLKNTVVRMPGPSYTKKRWMSNIRLFMGKTASLAPVTRRRWCAR